MSFTKIGVPPFCVMTMSVQILDLGDGAQSAHDQALFAAHNHAAAGIDVVRRDGVGTFSSVRLYWASLAGSTST